MGEGISPKWSKVCKRNHQFYKILNYFSHQNHEFQIQQTCFSVSEDFLLKKLRILGQLSSFPLNKF